MADQMKYSQKHGLPHPPQGQDPGHDLEKNSTRTRVSFEVGMFQLGGRALFLSGRESQIGRGEPVEDTAGCSPLLRRHHDPHLQKEVEKLTGTPTSPSSTASPTSATPARCWPT